ncbi:hypothetical protein BLOT_000037 [Blomia tropicalis]|nr:hypothetical protein BLOT_000037 [Blomia tropicalis]
MVNYTWNNTLSEIKYKNKNPAHQWTSGSNVIDYLSNKKNLNGSFHHVPHTNQSLMILISTRNNI